MLVIWNREGWGSIITWAYIDHILQPIVLPFFEKMRVLSVNLVSPIFMDDNASAHTAKIIKEFKRQYRIISLDWPTYSLDLNPIENVWNLLKNRLQSRQPPPGTKDEIKQAVVEK